MDKNITKSERDMVDLLNQEIKELQESQKQIEEMAKVVRKYYSGFSEYKVEEEWDKVGIRLVQARKETAEKFAERLKENRVVTHSEQWGSMDFVEWDKIDEICKELVEGE